MIATPRSLPFRSLSKAFKKCWFTNGSNAGTTGCHHDPPSSTSSQPSSVSAIQSHIKNLVNNSKLAVFMKGTPDKPLCQYSRTVSQLLLSHLGDNPNQSNNSYVRSGVSFVNVLESPEVRQGVKEFSGWPTIPQVFMGGKFVGGCDVITDLAKEGKLMSMLREQGLIGGQEDEGSTDDDGI